MMAAQADTYIAALLDRLFRDDKKDITFQLLDGKEFAHEAVLRAASDVFGQMLEHVMQEKTTRTISLPHVSCKVMRVFLRLIYSASVDKSDWEDEEEDEAPEGHQDISLLKQRNMQIDGLRLTRSGSDSAWALLSGGGAGNFSFSVQAERWHGVLLGIAPVGSPLDATCNGFYGYQASERSLVSLCRQEQDDTFHFKQFPSKPRLRDGAKITVKFEDGSLSFAVNNGSFIDAPFDTNIPTGIAYAPAVLLTSQRTLDIIEVACQSKSRCPLGVLFGVASLAETYMIDAVSDMCTMALKERIASATARKDVGAFEGILASAISSDNDAVRMAALKAAENFEELRARHDKGHLRPEVSHALRAIWPPPAAKRRRLERLS